MGDFLAYSMSTLVIPIILASPDGTRVETRSVRCRHPYGSCSFPPDGSLLAATDGIEIRIWRVEGGKLLYVGKLFAHDTGAGPWI